MIVDLNNTTEYDKQIIYLNSKNATFNKTGTFDYYIELNDYHRISTSVNVKGSTFKYFDAIPFNHTDYHNDSLSKFKIVYGLTSSNWTDPTLYTLNPIEHNTRRFNIIIRNKDFNILNLEGGEFFNMTICVYTIKKNIYG